MNKKILLIGGRSKAKALATSLLQSGYEVTAINASAQDCQKLAEISGLKVLAGDGTKPYILEDANAGAFAMAIALTSQDQDNLVCCQLCKKLFHVQKTVALVSDPAKRDFFHKMGIDSVVCAIATVADVIKQQALVDDIANVLPLGSGQVQITELRIPAVSPAVGKKLLEINLPKDIIVGCLMRDTITMIPRGDTKILANDKVVIISTQEQQAPAIKELTGRC